MYKAGELVVLSEPYKDPDLGSLEISSIKKVIRSYGDTVILDGLKGLVSIDKIRSLDEYKQDLSG